jgi:hypothetical protein
MSKFILATFVLAMTTVLAVTAGRAEADSTASYFEWARDCDPVYPGLQRRAWCPSKNRPLSFLELSTLSGSVSGRSASKDAAAQTGREPENLNGDKELTGDCGCRRKPKGKPTGIKELLEKARGE